MTDTTTLPAVTGGRTVKIGEGGAHAPLRSKILVMGALTLTALYMLLPIWWLMLSATKSNSGLFRSFGFWFDYAMNLGPNVAQVLTENNGRFLTWMANSILYAGVGAFFATLLGAACGYAIAKFQFRGRNVILGSIMAGVLLPSALLTVPLYLMFSQVGLVNTYWSVLIPSVVSPFAVYLCKMYAETTVPDELLEAARIDGAGEVRIFFTIVLRVLSPALVTVFLFVFVSIWNNFFLPMIMLSNETLYPVTLGIYSWFTIYQQATFNIVITGSLLSVLPLIVAFLALQRFWRSGLTAGAVKG